jgi:arylsulfatase A-like enzyme
MRQIRCPVFISFFAVFLYSCSLSTPAAVFSPTPSVTSTQPFTSTGSPTETSTQTFTPTSTPTETFTPTPSPTPYPDIRRVVIISIDGLRPDGLLHAKIPRISELITGGASTFSAQTVFPSTTLPAHASMLSGRCVAKHGITWDDLDPSKGRIQGATVFSVAKDAGLRTIMVVGKDKLITIDEPGTVDSFHVEASDEKIIQTALEEASAGFGILFVHLTLPDSYGHGYGWMSATYLQVIGQDDTYVGSLIDGLRTLHLWENTLLILTSDHGGHEKSHGSAQKEDMTIPWIIFGPRVLSWASIGVPVVTMDTAATAVWALGLDIPSDWDGRPVVEAFGLQAENLNIATASADRCDLKSLG